MQSRSPNGFFLSALLHGSVAAIVLFGAYACQEKPKESVHIIELVQGPGDNYSATEAAALGVEGGIKVTIPDSPPPSPTPPTPEPPTPTPTPEPPAPTPPKPTPPAPVEKAKPTPSKEAPVVPNMANQIRKKLIRAESKVKQAAKKEREAEAKRISKEEFDRKNKAQAASGTGKATRIDAEGISNGVIGGSTANKKGGANGKALSREQADAIDEYWSILTSKIRQELDERPGISPGLLVEVEIHVLANGNITGIRVTKSSGSPEFDQAAKETLHKIDLPPRPPGYDEYQRFSIRSNGDN